MDNQDPPHQPGQVFEPQPQPDASAPPAAPMPPAAPADPMPAQSIPPAPMPTAPITTPAPVAPVAAPKTPGSKKWLAIALIVVLLAVAATVGYMVMHKTKKPTPAATTSSSQSAANAISAQDRSITGTDVISIDTQLEAYFANNTYYPSTIDKTTLPSADPSVFTPPAGVKYVYTVTPTGCTTAAKNCQHFTLTAVWTADNSTVTSKQSLQ